MLCYVEVKLFLLCYICCNYVANVSLQDVFIVDTGKECFVWIGCRASREEKQNAMAYAHVSASIWMDW